MTDMENSVKKIMEREFSDDDFILAITHKSMGEPNNERWEFLGNAIFNMHLATVAYALRPELNPEEMTLICNNARSNKNLNRIGRENGLDKLIITGKSVKNEIGVEMVATAFEAVIGMLFEKSGIDAATRFIDELIIMDEENIERYKEEDPITELKKYLDKNGRCGFIEEITERKDDKTTFFDYVIHYGDKSGKGSGPSKKEAESEASRELLRMIKK